MNDEQLEQLLSDADAAVPPEPTSHDLAKQVLRRAHRRTQIRGTLGIAVALLLAAIVSWQNWRPRLQSQLAQGPKETPAHHQSSPETNAKVQMAQLEIDAELHQSLAVALLRASARQESDARSAKSFVKATNLEASFAETRDETAHLMIMQADRLLNKPDGRSQAIETYRRVTELFPTSSGASAARERLQQLRA